MYPLSPMKLYMYEGVDVNPQALARVRRMVEAMGRTMAEVVRFNEDSLPEVIAELQTLWPPETVPEGQVPTYMRPLVFIMQRWGDAVADLKPLIERCPEGTGAGCRTSWGSSRRCATRIRARTIRRRATCAGRRWTSAR